MDNTTSFDSQEYARSRQEYLNSRLPWIQPTERAAAAYEARRGAAAREYGERQAANAAREEEREVGRRARSQVNEDNFAASAAARLLATQAVVAESQRTTVGKKRGRPAKRDTVLL